MDVLQPLISTCAGFLSQNWALIVSVALGVFLYQFVRQSIQVLWTVILIGIALTLATHLGYLPPIGEMVSGLVEAFRFTT